MNKSYGNHAGQIVEPTRSECAGHGPTQAAAPAREISRSDLRVERAFHEKSQELGVAIHLGGLCHPLPATEATELAQTLVAWLSRCDDPRLEFPLDDTAYSVDREGAFVLGVQLVEQATQVAMLNALTAYEVATKGVDRREAMNSVGAFWNFTCLGTGGLRQLLGG